MTDPWATIVAAIITAISTVIAVRFEDFVNLFRKASRNLNGEWKGESYAVHNGKIQNTATSEYVVTLTQRGEKVRGTMTQVKVSQDTPSAFKWSGKVLHDYLIYDSLPTGDTKFFISSGLLHIHPNGEEMSGYIVANSVSNEPNKTRIRFTKLSRHK